MKKKWLLLVICLTVIMLGGCKDKKTDEKVPDFSTLKGMQEYYKGKKIAVITGSSFEVVYKEYFSDAKAVYFDDDSSAITALANGSVDGVIEDKPVATEMSKSNDKVKMIDVIIKADQSGFVFNKNKTKLCGEVNETLAAMKADGRYDKIYEKWFGEDTKKRKREDVKLTGENGTLKIYYNPGTPFTYKVEEGVIGFNIDILNQVCIEHGYSYEILATNVTGVIAAATSNKADISMSNLSMTEERKEAVLFSDVVFNGGVVMTARKDIVEKSASNLNESELKQFKTEGIVLGGYIGSYPLTYAEKYFKNAEISTFNSYQDTYEAVRSGRVNAAVGDKSMESYVLRDVDYLRCVQESFGKFDVAIGINRKSDKFTDLINECIKALREDGTLADMEKRWFVDMDTTMPDIKKPKNPTITIKCGTSGTCEPASYYGDNETLTGFDIELIKRMALYMNADIKISVMNYDGLIAGLQSDKLDIVVAYLNITEERKKVIDYSEPYLTDEAVLYVNKNRYPDKYEGLNTYEGVKAYMNGKNAGVMMGSVHADMWKDKFENVNISEYNTTTDLNTALVKNKVSGYLLALPRALSVAEEDDSIFVTGISIQRENCALILNKKNNDLLKKFNKEIKKLRDEGTLDEMYNRWCKPEGKHSMPDIKLDGSKGTIKVATTSDAMCFSYVENGELTGYDVETVKRICSALGYKVEFLKMDFSGIIAAVTSGKADIGMSSIIRTEERAKQVAFTDTTLTLDLTVVLNKSAISDYSQPVKDTSFLEDLKESFKKTFIVENRYKLILSGIRVTVEISIFSLLLGSVLGFGVCMLRRSKKLWLNIPAKIYIRVVQGTPIVVILMILYYIVFGDVSAIFVAVIGFSINFAAYVSEMLRTGIDAVDSGQIEAAKAMGFRRIEVFRYVTMPQAARYFLPVFKGEFISLVKMTSVVGYIAGQDLTKMSDIIRSRTYEAFFPLITTAVIYFLISALLISSLGYIERVIDPKNRKRVVKGIGEVR